MARYIIKEHERAKKRPLSETEKTVQYTLYLTESQKRMAEKINQKGFRNIIDEEIERENFASKKK